MPLCCAKAPRHNEKRTRGPANARDRTREIAALQQLDGQGSRDVGPVACIIGRDKSDLLQEE